MSGLDDLLNEVPDWVGNATGIRAVFGAIGGALDRLRASRADIYQQLFITTADWALAFWENELALSFDPNLTTEQRRQRILGRFRSRNTPTPKAVRAMANSFQNGDVETYMDWEKYTLYVRFVDVRGIPPNITELQDQITKMVDANLQVVYQFRYLTVGELAQWNNSVSALQQVRLTVRQLMTWAPTTLTHNVRDLSFRFKLRSPTMMRDTSLRYKVISIQSNWRSLASRFRTSSANTYRSLATRLNLIAPHQPIYWGAWVDYNSGGFTPNAGSYGGGGTITGTDPLSVFESHAGKQVSMVHFNNGSWMSNGAYQTFNAVNLDRDIQHGRLVVTEWHNWDLAAPANDFALRLAAVAAGNHDAYITQWATDCKNWGGPIIIRMPHEMNASWANAWPWSVGVNGSATVTFGGNTWTNTEADYINFFRHVVGIFRSVGCTNARFFWCPNVRSPTDHPYANYYPGKDANGKPYADWIGWDAYPFFGDTMLQSWRAGETTVDTYAEIAALDPTLPMMIGETAWSGRRGSTMSVTSITASGTALTVVVPSSPGGGGWQATQGLVLTGSGVFNGSYAITSVTGTGPYTLVVPSTATGTYSGGGTAAMVDRITRASLVTSDLETNIPAMPRIKAVQFFWTFYSDDQWTQDYAGGSDQANNVDMVAFRRAIGNAYYLAGSVMGTNLDSLQGVPFESQALTDKYIESVKSVTGLEGFWPLTDAALSATAADVSGKGRNGTVNGNIGLGTTGSIPAYPGLSAPLFPGVSGNNVQIADNDAWSITTTNYLGFDLWYYIPTTPTAQGTLLAKGDFAAGTNYEYVFYVSGSNIGFSLNLGNGGTYAANTPGLPAIGRWHHVGVSCDLTNTTDPISIWVDAVKQPGSFFVGGAVANGPAPLMIGQRSDSGAFNPLENGGRIAMVAAYSQKLTQATMDVHYSLGH